MKFKLISEIANAHFGNYQEAIYLGRESLKNNADFIKFQVYSADELYFPGKGRFSHFKKQQFDKRTWKNIFKNFDNNKVICDVFGLKSLELCLSNNIKNFKIHLSDLNNEKLIEAASKEANLFFLSISGSKLNDLVQIKNLIRKFKIKNIILIYGFQNYPTNINDINLNNISTFKKLFGKNVDYAYADHSEGSSIYSYLLPALSINLGYTYLEKHVTRDREKKLTDYFSSINVKDLNHFKQTINGSLKTTINKNLIITKNELKYSVNTKKNPILIENLKKYSKLKKENFKFLRSKSITNSLRSSYFENKRIIKDLKAGNEINGSVINNKVGILILARNNSKRLKNKIFLKLENESCIQHLIKRLKKSNYNKEIIICTTKSSKNLRLIKIAKQNNIKIILGPELNVLKRISLAIKKFKLDHIVRITGDDILIDTKMMDKTIQLHLKKNSDYTNNKLLPSGTECEVFSKSTIDNISKYCANHQLSEYLTYYVSENKHFFNISKLKIPKKMRTKVSFSIDTFEEFSRVKNFLKKMKERKKLYTSTASDLIEFTSKIPSKEITEKIDQKNLVKFKEKFKVIL